MKKISIPKSEMVREHEHLVPILRHGTKQQREKEANKQQKELSEYRKYKKNSMNLYKKLKLNPSNAKPGDLLKAVNNKKQAQRKVLAALPVMMKKKSKEEDKKHEMAESPAMERKEHMKKGSKNWIQGAIKKPGALRASLGVKKGSKIPAGKLRAAAKKGGKMGRRARLAMTLKKLHKSKSKKA